MMSANAVVPIEMTAHAAIGATLFGVKWLNWQILSAMARHAMVNAI